MKNHAHREQILISMVSSTDSHMRESESSREPRAGRDRAIARTRPSLSNTRLNFPFTPRSFLATKPIAFAVVSTEWQVWQRCSDLHRYFGIRRLIHKQSSNEVSVRVTARQQH